MRFKVDVVVYKTLVEAKEAARHVLATEGGRTEITIWRAVGRLKKQTAPPPKWQREPVDA